MKTAMQNDIHGDQPTEYLTERLIASATRVSLIEMSSDFPVIFRNAILSNIGLQDLAGLKHELHGHYVRRSNPEEYPVFFHAFLIIMYKNSLLYP